MKQPYQSGNPFKKIKYIPPISDILKISYRKADNPKGKFVRKRQTREEKISAMEKERILIQTEEIIKRIEKIINQFPWIDDIHPFYKELCDLTGNIDRIKKALGRLQGIAQQIKLIKREQLNKLYSTNHPAQMAQIRRGTAGRYASLLKKASGDVRYLIKSVKILKTVPDFNLNFPTIVIAGAPNVGKSSLVKAISTGKPEVGEYPFTTKQVVFGHRAFNFIQTQIVDTPGLLDRPFQERNTIERQSIASIKYIADLIIFMFDISKDAVISSEEQLNLLRDITKEFQSTIIIRVLNKTDILKENEIRYAEKSLKTEFHISIKDKESILPLVNKLENDVNITIKSKEKFKKLVEINIAEEFIQKNDEDFDYEI